MCVFATTKYHIRFNEQRKFNELEKVDLTKAIDAEILSTDLRGLKWITPKYPNDPEVEISNLLEIMEILKNDNSKKALLTDYQFLGPVLDIYDFSLIDVFLKFKFINILIIILSIILVTLFKKKKNLKNSIIILTSILLSCLLIFHQYLTSNQNYIFFFNTISFRYYSYFL